MPIPFEDFLRISVSLPQDPVYYYSLYQYCSMLPANSLVVEIGTWQAVSTVAMGCALQGTGGHIITIDPISLLEEKEEEKPEPRIWKSSFREITDRIKEFNLEGYISIVPDYSENVLKRWDGREIDLLHIDGDHSYEGVTKDCEWVKWVKNGGYVTFDDWNVYRDIVAVAAISYLSQYPEFVLLHGEGETPCQHPTWSTTIYQRQKNL